MTAFGKLGVTRYLGPANGLKRQLVEAVAGAFGLNLASKLLMLGTSVLLARLMGAAAYGTYVAAVATVTLVGVPASLGLPNLVVREVAGYHLRGEWGLMKGLLMRSNQAVLLVAAVLALALLSWQLFSFGPVRQDGLLCWLAFGLLPLTLLGALRMATLRGLHHIALGMVPEALVMPLAFIGLILVAHLLFHADMAPQVVVTLRLLAVGGAFVVGVVFLWRKLPKECHDAQPQYRTDVWARSAGPLMWVGAMSVITTQTDVLMLSSLRDYASAGIYQIAARGAELVAFISAISNVALQPTIARLYVNRELKRLQRIATLAARVMFGAASTSAAVFIVGGHAILGKIFGPTFAEGAPPLAILSIGWVAIALFGPSRDILLMTGGEKEAAWSISVGAIANILLNILLIPRMGAIGAAVATAFSMILCNACFGYAVRRRLGYWISPLPVK